MNIDLEKAIWLVAQIHDWNRPVQEHIKRVVDIIHVCEELIQANEEVQAMEKEGLSPVEMMLRKGISLPNAMMNMESAFREKIATGALNEGAIGTLPDLLDRLEREYKEKEKRNEG